MAKLVCLGSGAAIPDDRHENTHLALIGAERLVIIDCGGDPIRRMRRLGIDLPQRMTDLVLTHFHPDHVGGAPSLIMGSWLLGRTSPLAVYGLDYTIDRIEKLLEMYEWDTWPRMYPVQFHRLPEQERALVLDCPDYRIYSSPVRHHIPNVGLRVEFASGGVAAYSSDTSPCDAIVDLAQDADLLIHETAGAAFGHSSASQAGEIARRARAKELMLIHYPTGDFDAGALIPQAAETFGGPVKLAEDWMEITF